MPDGFVVYMEIEPEPGGMFDIPGSNYKNVFLSISAGSLQEAVERATDELPLRAYKRVATIRACALDDMQELSRW